MQKKYFLFILATLFPFFFLWKETILFADDDSEDGYNEFERNTEEYYEKRYEQRYKDSQSFQPDTTTSASNSHSTTTSSSVNILQPQIVQPTSQSTSTVEQKA